MKLNELIQHLPFLEKRNFSNLEITGLAFDSRQVQSGNLFIAIPGIQLDGHAFIGQALDKGAIAVVVEKNISIPPSVPVFRVENSRVALSRLASHWFNNPSHHLKVIGVTGTNGKTTISHLIEAVLEGAGIPAGRIGTIGCHYSGGERKLQHTTPESTEIHKMLKEMKDHGVDSVVMEVSSHAIDLHRVDDIQFDLAIFTNLSPEHLDYHMTMELYFESKKKLFTLLLPQGRGMNRAIINADDPYGQRLLEAIKDTPVWTYSTHPQSKWDLFARNWKSDLNGMSGILNTPEGEIAFTSPLIGNFNLSNILATVGAALNFHVPLKSLVKTLQSFSQIPGRLERIQNTKGLHVFVDYAHTPDALKKVLQALREADASKIITVFGCGGDRDRTKRPMMGREAARFSEMAVVTSDNPRTEDPEKIIQDILPGIEEGGMVLGKDCLVEPDRRKAIEWAISQATKGDVVLIAGKGHEDYQIFGTSKIHFDDREVAREVLNAL